MTNVFIMLGGVVLFGAVVTLYDMLARRQHRRRSSRRSA